MNKVLTAIGLMSGTSGDGIDSSIIQSDGEEVLRIIGNQYIPYDNILKVFHVSRKNYLLQKSTQGDFWQPKANSFSALGKKCSTAIGR